MVEKQNIINPENNSSVSPDEMITPENSIAIANAVEEDPNFQVVVDDMAAEGRRKNETILTSRESLHAETVKKLERRILAERNALEGADINIEERENSKIWWDMGTDHNESLDAAIEAENLDREQIQKRLDEYQALLAQAQENYKKTQDDQKLGDEAVKAGDYQKAQEFYNQAARWISHQNQEIQDKIGESAQLAEDTVAQAELWKEIAWGVRTTAIVVGATLAAIPSGWTSLAGLWSALAVGTTAWALGQAAEQGWEVYFNNKDGTEAFIDGAKGTWQAALDSALAAVGMGTGLKVAGMAGKGILSTGAIAGWVNTATQSAARTGIDVSQKTATFIAENWDKVKDLSASEIANVYAAHMAEQGLAPGDIAKNFAFDVATWALGWGIWAKFGPLQEATKWAIKQLGLQASEVWSDAALAVLSAHARNYMDNGTWDASPEEIQKELANALTGSLTGKYAAARKSMSQARWSNIEPPSATTEEVTPDNPRTVVPDKIFDTGNPEELTTGNLRPRIQETIKNAGDEGAQNTKRVEIAEEMIQQLRWRKDKLTRTEHDAILDAHEIKPSGADGEYTPADIAKKTRMLAEAFPWNENKWVREALIRNGIAGTAEAMVSTNIFRAFDTKGKIWISLDGVKADITVGGKESLLYFDPKTQSLKLFWPIQGTIIKRWQTFIDNETLKSMYWESIPANMTVRLDWNPDWQTVVLRKIEQKSEQLINEGPGKVQKTPQASILWKAKSFLSNLFRKKQNISEKHPNEDTWENPIKENSEKVQKTPQTEFREVFWGAIRNNMSVDYINRYWEPKNKMKFWEHDIYLTDRFKAHPGGEYEYCVGYEKIDGKMETRFFYKSRSEWSWRSCPGVHVDEKWPVYWKGPLDIGYSYEKATALSPQVGFKFDTLPSTKEIFINPIEYSDKYWHWEPVNDAEFARDTQSYQPFLWANKYNMIADKIPGNMSARGFQSLFRNYQTPGLSIDALQVHPEFNYQFYNGKLKSQVNVTICSSYLDGKPVDIHFANQAGDWRVWVHYIEYNDREINSFWVPRNQINAWFLTSKPLEYTSQLPASVKNGIWEDPLKWYTDIRDYLQELPLIQRFLQIRRGAI